ncbi:MAG TPA: hypothetical protein VGO01_20795 [Bradyrhizobium sp.]|nr:hypothetical protein [Bradyrhizobium sp.]
MTFASCLAIATVLFFGTLLALDYWLSRNRDQIRIEHVISLRKALDAYHVAHGSYPIMPDNPVEDLTKFLVGEGYLDVIPTDPLRAFSGDQYRYVSDGLMYGLVMKRQLGDGAIRPGGLCITGVGYQGTGVYDNPPDCPFFGTLFALDHRSRDRDQIRIEHVIALRKALDAYHVAHGSYPALPDNPVENLTKFLVGEGYLDVIPTDPLRAFSGDQYRYVSDGLIYGLLMKHELGDRAIRPGGLCITGVGYQGTGVYGNPPDCPFFGKLFALDYWLSRNRDQIRIEHVIALRKALDAYHVAHGSYPILPDNPVENLTKFLVGEGYLDVIPTDPLRAFTGDQYRYVSDGLMYGLLMKHQLGDGAVQPGGLCITGVGYQGTGVYGNPPDCPFFGILFALDHRSRDRDQIRIEHVIALRKALDAYHVAHGSYPVLPDNPVEDLTKFLVGEGYLDVIPTDPSRAFTGDQYRYGSDGLMYGLIMKHELGDGQCITGVGYQGTGIYGTPPDCPFFGTLFALDHRSRDRDQIRIEHVIALRKALDAYHVAHGSYPILPDNPVEDLTKFLVGYLDVIPTDPSRAFTGDQYRYGSDGSMYGLLMKREVGDGAIRPGGQCITGVGYQGTGIYGNPPDCPPFGTLFALDHRSRDRDQIRIDHVIALRRALDAYHVAHGSYPVLPDNPVEELTKFLVGEGHLDVIPTDPLRAFTGDQYRYGSNGLMYGLIMKHESGDGAIRPGGLCITGVGYQGTGIYGNPPDCPFFGTLFALDHRSRDRDQIRIEQVISLRRALAAYYVAHGSYPALTDNPVQDLTKFLVGKGYLAVIPNDPLRAFTGDQYRYASAGLMYGLLVKRELGDKGIRPGGLCITGVGYQGTSLYGNPPECPF